MTIESTYRELLKEQYETELSHPELLNEFRILRGLSVLVLAARTKTYGDKVVSHANKGKQSLDKLKSDKTIEQQITHIGEALEEQLNASINIRYQIGSLVGISVAAALISERSDNQLKKITKGKRR